MQLLCETLQIFKFKKLPLWIKSYEILATGFQCGLIEMINDAMCIDEIHKQIEGGALIDYFVSYFGKGKRKSKPFRKARNNFLYSLVAYSLA